MADRISYRELAARLAQDAEILCQELLPGGRIIGGEYRCKDISGGGGRGQNGGSLAVCLKGRRRGRWADFADPQTYRGDMLHLVAATQGCSLPDAAEWACQRYGLSVNRRDAGGRLHRIEPLPVRRGERERVSSNANRRRAFEIWRKDSEPIAGTPGETYFRNRGITIRLPLVLRYSRALYHGWTGLRYPAVIAAVQSPDGRFGGIWRIWIADDGSDKAAIAPARAGLGTEKGGAVRLASAGPELGIAEGIEDSLAVLQAKPELPMWASLSSSLMPSLQVPDPVNSLVIFPDEDPEHTRKDGSSYWPGQDAARALRRRMLREKRAVRIGWLGETGLDPNALLRRLSK